MRKYTMESAALVEQFLDSQRESLPHMVKQALELALNALQTLARAEERDDFASFVHGVKKDRRPALRTSMMFTDVAMQCPECGAWFNRQEKARYRDDELLRCLRIAVDCSKGLDVGACENCPVAKIPHNPALDCDAAMLEVAIHKIVQMKDVQEQQTAP